MVIEFSMLKNAKGSFVTEGISRFPSITWASVLLRVSILALLILLIPAPSYADINSSLLKAAEKGDINKVKALLDKGANPNTRDHGLFKNSNNTPLMLASFNNHKDITEELIKRGAIINEVNVNGNSALAFAAWKGNSDIAISLMKHGADVNLKDNAGQSPLFVAIAYGHTKIEIVKELLNKGAFVNVKKDNGHTPLLQAVDKKQVDVIKLLLKNGADPTASTALGKSVLTFSQELADAGKPEYKEITQLLTDARAKGKNKKVLSKQGNASSLGKARSKSESPNNTSIKQSKHSSARTTNSSLISPNGSTIGSATLNKESYFDYAGYSKSFLPTKQKLYEGNLDDIASANATLDGYVKKTAKNEKDFIDKIGALRWLERGTLAIDQGKFDTAVKDFSNVETMIDEKKQESKASSFFKKIFVGVGETITGNNELGPYEASGWEKVLMLNYKSIAYLLQGDRRAYNVTRRAIDWQNIEKKAFDQKMLKEKKKLEKKRAQKKLSKQKKSSLGIESGLLNAFSKMDVKASSVPSAYVNPFGYYIQGIVQEFESYEDRSLRDNARISYKKALELNPNSEVLQKSVDAIGKPARKASRLLHIIVADGLVPEKQVLTYNVQLGNMVVPLKLPMYTPVESQVYRIEVQSKTGKHVATLSTIADIEAMCLRQQKDMQQVLMLRAIADFSVASVMSSMGQKGEGFFGAIVGSISDARKKSSAPDTRSWMSLPARIQAARINLRRGVKQLKIVSFNKKGKKLATKLIQIDPDNHLFIYVRSIDKALYTQTANELWIAKR